MEQGLTTVTLGLGDQQSSGSLLSLVLALYSYRGQGSPRQQ
jgi:hypothetical protein